MPFPETLDELRAAGYTYKSTARCRGCQAVIEFWLVPPDRQQSIIGNTLVTRKLSPFDIDGQGNVTSHFATCPKVKLFRKERA